VVEHRGLKLSGARSESLSESFGKGLHGADLNEAVLQVSCTPNILMWASGHYMRASTIDALARDVANDLWLPRLVK
jgi:hypothetical protein